MGACGSTKQITPGDVTKSADQSLWKPNKLTFEMIKKAFPEFAKDLKSIRMVSMSQTLEWPGGQGQSQDGQEKFVDELENGGSETGAMLRKMECTWNENVSSYDNKHPKYVIVKMTDVTEVPQMALLQSKPWLKRWIVKKLLAGPGQFLWDAIPRVILAESRWNIFWNGDVKTEKDKEFDKEGCVRFIDLTNFGTGRVAWEVLYFLTTSYHYDWDENLRLLKDYYNTLEMHMGGTVHDYSFRDFRTEYYLLALLHCAHHFAKLVRTGKFSGQKAKKLRRQSTTVGKKGGKARKTIGNVMQQTESLLKIAADIFKYEEESLFGKPCTIPDSALK